MAFQVNSLPEHLTVSRLIPNSWLPCNKLKLLLLSPVAVVAQVRADQSKVFPACLLIWLVFKVLVNQEYLASLKALDRVDCPVVEPKALVQANSQAASLHKEVEASLTRFQVCRKADLMLAPLVF
jgi:hypothetical protein